MENASKALLIAGSILIVILLIAVGMMVFGGAQANIEGSLASMSSQEKEAFNNQFLMYQGNQKGSAVKTMISKIIANNSNEEGHAIGVVFDSTAVPAGNTITAGTEYGAGNETTVSQGAASITNSATYKIVFDYTSGVISKVTISK